MIKSRTGNFFEDFEPGQVFRHGVPRTLSEGDRALYIGLTGSRSALMTAETTATAMGLHAAPLEDLLVFNVAFGKTVPDISLNAVANLGYADVRFLRPVYSGDTLSVSSRVLAVKENSNGKSGVVYVRSETANQNGEPVLTFIRWVMVHKRGIGGAPVATPLPELPASVPTAQLCVPALQQPQRVVDATGVDDLWDDYEVGERIDHPGAMTINDSDHSIATRLYQNTALAHFDGFGMATTPAGKRLVYGGHVMSVCRSLAYDGFENSLGMLAINGGSHVSPTYAGDTLRCASWIVDRHALDSSVGALRLRTIGAKNLGAAALTALPAQGSSRPVHAQGVVLDLDYTILMPRKVPTQVTPR